MPSPVTCGAQRRKRQQASNPGEPSVPVTQTEDRIGTHRVPTLNSLEPSHLPVTLERVVAPRDIIQPTFARVVQPRVQEPQRRAALLRKPVVDERDDARERRARRARAPEARRLTLPHDEAVRLRGDVRERAAPRVVLALRGLCELGGVDLGEIGRDGGGLVERGGVVVRESAGGAVPGFFGREPDRTADRGDTAEIQV